MITLRKEFRQCLANPFRKSQVPRFGKMHPVKCEANFPTACIGKTDTQPPRGISIGFRQVA